MAAYELTIKAMSYTDLQEGVADLAKFLALQSVPAPEAEAEGVRAPLARTSSRKLRAQGRAGGLLDDVSAAATAQAAGAASADAERTGAGDQDPGSAGRAAGGDAGAVGSEAAAEDQVEAGQEAQGGEAGQASEAEAQEAEGEEAPAPEAPAEEGPQADAAPPAATDDAAAVPGDAAADASDLPGDAAGAAALGDGAAEITIEQVKAAIAKLIGAPGKGGFSAAQALLGRHGVKKPGDTPVEKRAAILADIEKELA